MTDIEKWVPVEEYEGLYEVSNLGNVRSLDRISKSRGTTFRKIKGTIRAKAINKNGYHQVTLNKKSERKTISVHKLVLRAFGEIKENSVINHIDGNPLNNRIENLESVSPRENSCHRFGRYKKTGTSFEYGKYRARIRINAKSKNLGTFDTLEEAHQAYINALSTYGQENKYINGFNKNALLVQGGGE